MLSVTNRARLRQLGQDIVREFPVQPSADQFAREVDLAIDFCEDVEALSAGDIDRTVAHSKRDGRSARSMNGWFGSHDKRTMSKRILRDVFALDAETQNEAVAFIGDPLNRRAHGLSSQTDRRCKCLGIQRPNDRRATLRHVGKQAAPAAEIAECLIAAKCRVADLRRNPFADENRRQDRAG